MQEEVENRTLTLVVSGTKFTGRLFKAAVCKYMAYRREKKMEKQRSRDSPVIPHGKQSVKQLIRQNQEKAKKKREKQGLPPNKITQQASQNVKRINEPGRGVPDEKKEEAIRKATEYYNSGNLKAGSIASKANMVRQFDEKNKKK